MEDYLAAICILIMVLGLGLLVYDKVFLPVVSNTRVYSEDSYNKDNYTNNDIEYKNLDKTEELIKRKLGKDALVMYTSLESTGKDSEDVVVRVSLDSNEYRVIFNTKKVTKDMVYYEPISIKSINKIH
ncbi:hypothetical protein FDE98_15790 [Clostridium sporogenes]|uniref:DUF3139 domain-containing protein n=1 Tax=Clostridium sporogenes TaxID=1509 RepID=A0A7X5PBX1_CLOSG|nr:MULTISPECIES: hypothetical protein [Clostridium]AJD29082.1 hypothetical protein T258_3936 [Clostridium botulinum Prevot_594]NFL97909.1 hypothetical protein [Clostridium botulinum]NFM32484.1 hypothetical protein [Clostridium botulinum]NFP55434.1 hypothetical protein [Clostridium botulinum]NFQ17655.1 hypothetical protein [Clostridium sporogenes]